MDDIYVDPVSQMSETGMHSGKPCIIRVLGVGGGGGNTLQHMINQSLSGVEFIAVNTDSQALNQSTAPLKVQIGVKLTNGLGAGMDPNRGRKAAEESKEDVKKLLHGSDLVFITAGMGGGTGTGATPIIAEVAKETGALTVAVVTKPFRFEGPRHQLNAEAGITELSKHVDSLIVIDNNKLLKNLGANISIANAFNEANDVLLNAVRGITDAITSSAFINLDFADIKTVMRGRGHAMIGNGVGQGANFVEDAVQRAIHSPLIEQVDIKSATGLVVYARVNHNFPIAKWEQVCQEIQNYADEEADCKYGLKFDDELAEDQIVITILITGISTHADSASESPVSLARSNASIRRNGTNNNNTQSFFKFANQGAGATQAAPMDGQLRQAQPQTMQQPMQGVGADARQIRPMQQQPVQQGIRPQGMNMQQYGSDPQEVNVSKNIPNEDWEFPAILRNKLN